MKLTSNISSNNNSNDDLSKESYQLSTGEQVNLIFEPVQEGGYSAYVAEIPGVNSQGETLKEAKQMLLEALHELLEYRRDKLKTQ